MDEIINARWRGAGGLRTMVTLNFKSKDMPPRIASRLGDKSRSLVVQIEAEDMRKEVVITPRTTGHPEGE